ncbi:MAG: hypothetical protein HUJ95_04400, partial [Bacteroidales bacterium]|nr:hypothetical protein [Bacteroidales bacterium]
LKDAGDDPFSRGNKINEIVDTLADIPDAIKRELSIRKVSEMFGISIENIADRVRRTRREAAIHEVTAEQHREEGRRYAPQQSQSEATKTSSLKAPLPAKDLIEPNERELIEYIIVHGCDQIDFENGKTTVAEYIDNELINDGLVLSTPIYKKTYDRFFDYYEEGLNKEQIHNRLLENEDGEIKTLVSELLDEKYEITVINYKNQLTGSDARLRACIPIALVNYKLKVIKKKTTELSRQLKTSSPEEQNIILQQITKLNKLKVNLERNSKKR